MTAVWLAAGLGGVARAAETVVSLTFDDGRATSYNARSILASQGMHATFYINSAYVGSDDYYMTWPQIDDLASDGNEIGGHTLHHTNLTTVDAATAATEVCDDRTALQSHGYTVNSFAYPEIAYNATAQQVVRDCGYHSARAGDSNYPPAETLPPQDAYAIRTVPAVDNKTTLADLERYVTDVEASGGGWAVFLMHSVCSGGGCSTLSISPDNLQAFVNWLSTRGANGTVVKTVGEVIDGASGGADTTPPSSSIACNGAPCATGWYTSAPVTMSLAASDGQSGVADIKYTTDGSDPLVSGGSYTGPFGLAASATVRWYATDNAGNVQTPQSKSVRIDAVAPTVALSSPADGASYRRGSSVPLAATAADDTSGVAKVAFYVNGSLVGSDTTAPYGVNWNAKKRGTYTVKATATDAAGLSTASTTRTFTVG